MRDEGVDTFCRVVGPHVPDHDRARVFVGVVKARSLLFLIQPIFLVDLVIRGLNHVAHVVLAANDEV